MRIWPRNGRILALGVLALTVGLLTRPATAQGRGEAPKLKVGDVAPDFTLQYFDGHDDKDVKLSDFRGKKNVVLAFYIFAFTGG